ncbi:MAG: Ycf66 family protein [Cyanobacteria bacterium P01_C01_bin.120]
MNFGTPVPLLIGIVLILGGVALFFLDRFKPGYGRDSDKVYAVLWLISGVFLLGHLNMELLPSFQQLLMAGMLITLTIENVYSRTPRDERYGSQNFGSSPGRDEYYRPSRSPDYRDTGSSRMNMRAELDNEGPYRPRFPEDRRMIGGRDPAPPRTGYDDGYNDRYSNDRGGYGDYSMPPRERPVERLNPSSDRLKRRRPKASDGRYGDGASRGWDESANGYAANSDGYSSAGTDSYSGGRGAYSASSDSYSNNTGYSSAADSDNYVGSGGYSSHAANSSRASDTNSDGDDSYVDYRPVNYPDDNAKQPPTDYGSRY